MAASRRRAERVLSAAAPLVLAANQPAEVPDEVAFRAWEEFIYPRNGAEHPPSPGWERALAVINEWLSGRAVVLRGEQT